MIAENFNWRFLSRIKIKNYLGVNYSQMNFYF